METINKYKMNLVLFFGLIFFLSLNPTSIAIDNNPDHDNNLMTYIVHVQKLEGVSRLQSEELHNWYLSFLPQTSDKLDRMVFSYHNVASGFAMKLTPQEAKALAEKEEVVSARPERTLSLHTTHTPTFLGHKQGQGLCKDFIAQQE